MVIVNSSKNAFSLIEISIAIAIISGFLMIAVYSVSLLDRAKANSVMTEYSGHIKNTINFIDIYQCLPGDCTDFTYRFSDAVRNGNGDGEISNLDESYAFWNHLSVSSFYDHKYSGIIQDSNSPSIPNVNIPLLNSFGIMRKTSAYHILPYQQRWQLLQRNSNLIVLSDYSEGQNSQGQGNLGAVSTRIAKIIDQKFDDGKPHTGKILTINDQNQSCNSIANNQYDQNASYLDLKGLCIIGFVATELD